MSRDGRRCDFAEHPGFVHWSWVDGELQFWMTLTGPDEADVPQALKTARGPQIAGVYVDEFAHFMQKTKERAVSDNIKDLLARGRQPEVWNRPVVEGTTVSGSFTYGLLEANAEPYGYHVVDETVPESGGIPVQAVVHPDSLREVLVPGHRGGCAGDCCREGYSEDTSYPECWTWDQVRTGIAGRYRAWKDWAL